MEAVCGSGARRLLSCSSRSVRVCCSWFGGMLYQLLGLVSDVTLGIVYRNGTQQLPPVQDPLLLRSATELARQVRTGSVSSQQLVLAFSERIRQLQPILNCVTEDRFQAALEEARVVDQLISGGTRTEQQMELETPFLGVPFTAKDSVAIGGMKQTLGMQARRDCVAAEDAEAVRLMRRAGAIPLAHTNVPEACIWWDTDNKIYGRTSNPYVTSRSAGGSSGGEAALLAAAGSPMGLGSDLAGSIRMPCFFNGLFGLKPSSNTVSNRGHLPLVEGLMNSYLVIGPMSRYAEDLLPMYRVLVGSKDEVHQQLTQLPAISSIRFFHIEDEVGSELCSPVHADLRRAQKRLVVSLRRTHGICVTSVQLTIIRKQVKMWIEKIRDSPDCTPIAEILANGGEAINPVLEMAKSIVGKSEHTFPALMAAAVDKTLRPDPAMLENFNMLQHELNSLLKDDGVLIYPSHPTPAPYRHQPLFKLFNSAYTSIFNVLQMPVAQVPLGLGSWGVPLGVQIVAAPGRDALCLAVAEEVERLCGGWVNPSALETSKH